MAVNSGSSSSNSNPAANPNSNPNPSPAPSPGSGTGSGPTGNSGFSQSESTMSGLQNRAGSLGSQLSSITNGLKGLTLNPLALGPIGLVTVPAINNSNDHAVAQAERGVKAFGDVQAGLKATQQVTVSTDTNNAATFKAINPNNTDTAPPGSAGVPKAPQAQAGPQVSKAQDIQGGTNAPPAAKSGPTGPAVSTAPTLPGGTNAAPAAKAGPGGPNVSAAPTIPGSTNTPAGAKPGAPGGANVGAVPTIPGSTSTTPSVKTPSFGGGPIGATPTIPGAGTSVTTPSSGVGTGPKGTVPGAPNLGAQPGAAPTSPAGGAAPGGQSTDRSSKYTAPGGSTKGMFDAPKGPAGNGTISKPPVGNPSGSSPITSGGSSPSGVPSSTAPKSTVTSPTTTPSTGVLPPAGPKAGFTAPGSTPSNSGAQPGATPASPAGGAAPGGQSTDRSSKYTAPGAAKGVFDAPKGPVGNGSISKAPVGNSSTPSATPGSVPSSSTAKPGATPSVSTGSTGVPSTAPPKLSVQTSFGPQPTGSPQVSTGVQPSVTTGSTPGVTTPVSASSNANAQPGAGPMSPGGNPAAGGQSVDRNSKFTAPGAAKGAFDAPKGPVGNGSISKAPAGNPNSPSATPGGMQSPTSPTSSISSSTATSPKSPNTPASSVASPVSPTDFKPPGSPASSVPSPVSPTGPQTPATSKPGAQPFGPQPGVTSPTSHSGVQPDAAPLSPGGNPAAGSPSVERNSKFTAPGGTKDVFDGPKSPTGDGTVSKAPPAKPEVAAPSSKAGVTPPAWTAPVNTQPSPTPQTDVQPAGVQQGLGVDPNTAAPSNKNKFLRNPFSSNSEASSSTAANNNNDVSLGGLNPDGTTAPANAGTNSTVAPPPPPPPPPPPALPPYQAPAPAPVLPTLGNIPAFFQQNQALGTIAPTNVNGAPNVAAAVAGMVPTRPGVTPVITGDIETAINQNFESFLGAGRKFPVKVGNNWFEATVQAKMEPPASVTTAVTTPGTKTKVDMIANSGNATGYTGHDGTAAHLGVGGVGGVGGGGTSGSGSSSDAAGVVGGVISGGVGPYGSMSGGVQLAKPTESSTSGTSTVDSRAIRSGEGSVQAVLPVTYTVSLKDAQGNPATDAANNPIAPVTVDTASVGSDVDVTLQIPDDLSNIESPNPAAAPVTPGPRPNWGAALEHPAPEAVVDIGVDANPAPGTTFDPDKVFNDIAAQLHPSITKVGAPGRTELQNFLDPTTMRDNIGPALNGWVVSPNLVSPHGSRAGVVRMKATPISAELVGTNPGVVLRLHEGTTTSTGVTASTKSGGDVNAGFGGGAVVPGEVGGTAGAITGYGAKITESTNAGTSSTSKTGVQIKGDTGLYKVKMDVEVQTPHGSVTVPVTSYMRLGVPEAASAGLDVPAGTSADLATPTPTPRYAPPYLAAAAAAGNVKIGEFTAANQVQGQIENTLRSLPGFENFLPDFGTPTANPGTNTSSDKKAAKKADPTRIGKNATDLADMMANQRKLTTELSPVALKSQPDSLFGPGVQVQLKRQGLATNDFVNITVKARVVATPKHVGQTDARNVRGASSTGPKLDSSTKTTKGWYAGAEGKVVIPTTSGDFRASPAPTASVKYNSSTSNKTTAGPTVGSTALNIGSPNSQLFEYHLEFDVEITQVSQHRSWVKRVTPGSPFQKVPTPVTVAKTTPTVAPGTTAPGTTAATPAPGTAAPAPGTTPGTTATTPGTAPAATTPAPAGPIVLPAISGKANLWVSDSSTLKSDPAVFAPGPPTVAPAPANTTISSMLTSPKPKPVVEQWLHVEAVANAEAVRDAAIASLETAAKGDSSLGVQGLEARNRIDKLFSPESLKANLGTMVDKGVTEGGMKYGRRVADRTGAVGMSVELTNPRLVSISDDTGTENANNGGFKAGESKTTAQSVDITAGVNTPMRNAKGAGGVALGANAKWTPWSTSNTDSSEIGGSVDRNKVTPATGRTVLVQLDADFTVVGESRSGNTLYGGTPRSDAQVVTLPGGVFVRVTEDVARDMGLLDTARDTGVLPKRPAHTPPPMGTMAPPATLKPGEPGALGLSLVEKVPDLSSLVPNLQSDLQGKLGKAGKDLLPDSVLKDTMNNLQRMTDLTSDASVKALIDSAVDGGVPLLIHNPGVFGNDAYQVTLKATLGTPVFDSAVNDGVEMEHTIAGTSKISDSQGKGHGWGLGLRVPASGKPPSDNPDLTGSLGAAVGTGVGQAHSTSKTNSTTEQFGHLRAGSGPAVKYNVPVVFELVVEKGNQEIGRTSTTQQDMTVRLHADNQKTTAATPATTATTAPFNPTPVERSAAHGTPAAVAAWQAAPIPAKPAVPGTPAVPQTPATATSPAIPGTPATPGRPEVPTSTAPAVLPPTASVENFRGAQALQDAAIEALNKAGANKGITGKGTAPMNALKSGLSSESLQPNLPGMLNGALEVPGLHEAALTISQHANLKVYAKLVNPRLEALSDGVNLENPKTIVTATSSESSHSETGDVAFAAATGGLSHINPDVGFSTGGVEAKNSSDSSSATSGGATDNKVNNLKPQGRTGLVKYDVEYRVVADLGGGRVAVVDLASPDAVQVRMPAPEAETALGKPLTPQLDLDQTAVKDAAADWRKAVVEADKARYSADDTVNDLAPKITKANTDVTGKQGELDTVQGKLNTAVETTVPDLKAKDKAAKKAVLDANTKLGDQLRVQREVANQVDPANEGKKDADEAVEGLTTKVEELDPKVETADQAVKDAAAKVKAAEQALENHRNTPPPAVPEGQQPPADTVGPALAEKLKEAETELQVEKQKLDGLKTELNDLKDKLGKAEDAQKAADKKAKEVADAVTKADNDYQKADAELKKALADASTDRDNLAAAEMEVKELKAELKQADLDFKAAEKEKQDLADQLAQAEKNLQDKRDEADAKQQAWWKAKTTVDQQIDVFNTLPTQTPPPAPPMPPVPPAPVTTTGGRRGITRMVGDLFRTPV
jgi:hypothetical protein